MSNIFSLEGKTAIVTGAGRKTGLCFTMAKALQNAGAKIVLFDIMDGVFDIRDEMGGEANGVYAFQVDLCKTEQIQAAVDKAIEKTGHIDILLNGAGIQFRSPVLEFPPEKFDKVIEINLSSMFKITQIVARHMAERGSGKVINIASMCAFVGSRDIVAYTASKGGVMQMTKALSNELASKGINVNAIAPGYMETELTADVKVTELGKLHTARIPMGRWGKPEDLGGPVVFLASAASDYVSGVTLPIDGGYLGF